MNDRPPPPQEEHKELIGSGSAAEERVRLANQEEGRVAHEAKAAPDRRPRRLAFFQTLGSLFRKRR